MQFNYHIPTKILFGAGKLNALADEKLPGKKALIVTGGKSTKKYGYVDRLVTLLDKAGVKSVLFDKILPNPILDHVTEGAEIARAENCDFIIGLGGGSPIDSAKSIAIMAVNEGNYWDYLSGGSGKGLPVKNGALPIVAITTTAGTGTEADPWTVITKAETKEKIGFGLVPETFPVLSVVDPELMLTVPKDLTIYQGFDAFFHAAEGYIANVATPVSDMYALKSIELVSKHLPEVVKDGSNLEARTQVALANTISGFVESTSSCTSEHAMEHALSAFYPDLPHGAGLIMLCTSYFSFFADKVPDRFADMARAMGVDTNGMTESEAAKSFVDALISLQEKCGVNNLKMSEYGITYDEISEMAKNSIHTMGGLFDLDRYKLSLAETTEIMQKAFA